VVCGRRHDVGRGGWLARPAHWGQLRAKTSSESCHSFHCQRLAQSKNARWGLAAYGKQTAAILQATPATERCHKRFGVARGSPCTHVTRGAPEDSAGWLVVVAANEKGAGARGGGTHPSVEPSSASKFDTEDKSAPQTSLIDHVRRKDCLFDHAPATLIQSLVGSYDNHLF